MKNEPEPKTTLTKEQIEEYGRHLLGNVPKEGLCFRKGNGIRLEDINGKSYIDVTGQFSVNFLGFGNQEIAEAVYEQAQRLTTLSQPVHSEVRYQLAHKLCSIAPKNLKRVSFSVGGSLANEAAFKIALINRPEAKHFISLWGTYHGNTLTARAASRITALRERETMYNFTGSLNDHFYRAPSPYCYRCWFNQKPESCDLMCAQMMKLTIENGVPGPVAGVILEPIQSDAGEVAAPQRYLKRVREICDEYGIVLIFDEVQNYCRTGRFFAADYFGVEPDVISGFKGLGGGIPQTAILIHDRLRGFSSGMEELHSFAHNTVLMAAALKAIEIIERDNLLDHVVAVGEYVRQRLAKMQERYPEIGDIRAIGLGIAVELVEDPESKKLLDRNKCQQLKTNLERRGLIVKMGGMYGNVLIMKPPLIIQKEDFDEVFSMLEDEFKEILRK